MDAGQENNDEDSESVQNRASEFGGQDFIGDGVKDRNVGGLKAELEIREASAEANEEGEETRPGLDVVPLVVSLGHGDNTEIVMIEDSQDCSGYEAGCLHSYKD